MDESSLGSAGVVASMGAGGDQAVAVGATGGLDAPAGRAERLDRPVMIVGPLRAGTTLLRLLLDHHPRVKVFSEFEESVSRLGDTGWLSMEEYRAWLPTNRMFGLKKLTIDPTIGEYPALVHDLFRQLCGRTPKPLVGFTIHSRFDRALEIWPGARVIHITRDPRDVARSCIGMGWCGTVWHGAHYWLEAERRFERMAGTMAAGSWMRLKYEDLVREPERELRRVCAFLGIEFDPAMLEFHKDTTYEPIDPKLADQWKKKLSKREAEQVESRCADLMRARGYELSSGGGSTGGAGPRPVKGFERLGLWWGNRLGKTRFRVKRYGVGLVVAWALVKRLPTANGWRKSVRMKINAIDAKHLR